MRDLGGHHILPLQFLQQDKSMLTLDKAKENFIYNPETGVFLRVKNNKLTGNLNCKNKYIYLTIGRKFYLAHRVAWLMVYGEWPTSLIDHANQDKTDNRICNLRLADKSTNGTNRSGGYSSTGFRGIYFQKGSNKFRVRFKNIHFGYFDTLEEAKIAGAKALKNLYGEFAGAL